MPSYLDFKNQLTQIKLDVLEHDNPYHLDAAEKKDFEITVNTLIYIIDHIDILKTKNNVYFCGNDLAPIHLEVYPNETREPLLMGSLVELFITCFKRVKEHSTEVTSSFLKKLNGNCIDARTRAAFDVALDLDAAPTFTDLINQVSGIVGAEMSYFRLFSELLLTKWGTPFKADKGDNGFYRFNGVLNSDLFSSLQRFFIDILAQEPDSDSLRQLEKIPDPLKKIYLQFLLQTPNFQNLHSSIPRSTFSRSWIENSFSLNQHPETAQHFKAWDESALLPIKKLLLDPELRTIIPLQSYNAYLHMACRIGDTETANELINEGSSLFVKDNSGISSLSVACLFQQTDLICQLLTPEICAREQVAIEESFHFALEKNNSDIMQILFSRLGKDQADNCFLSVLEVKNFNLAEILFLQLNQGQKEKYDPYPDYFISQVFLYFSEKILTDKMQYVLTELFFFNVSRKELQQLLEVQIKDIGIVASRMAQNSKLSTILAFNANKETERLIQFMQGKNNPESLLFRSHSTEKIKTLAGNIYAAILYHTQINLNQTDRYTLMLALSLRVDSMDLLLLTLKQSVEITNELIKILAPLKWNNLISKRAHDDSTYLQIVFKERNASICRAIIDKVSPEALSATLLLKNNDDTTALHTAFRYQDAAICRALIIKTTAHELNTAIVQQNKANWTPLCTLLHYNDAVTCTLLINKISSDALNKALIQKNNIGFTALQTAFRKQNAAVCQSLIAKASPEALNAALLEHTHEGWTALQTAFFYQDSVTCQALIAKASVESLSRALVKTDTDCSNALQCILMKQDKATCQALIAKVWPMDLRNAAKQADNIKWTALHHALEHQDTSICLAIMALFSPAELYITLTQETDDGNTAFTIALSKQDAAFCQDLMTHYTSEDLYRGFIQETYNQSILLHPETRNILTEKNILPQLLLKVLTGENKLTADEMKKMTAFKVVIKNYILNMPNSLEKNKMLENALNPETKLGLYFTLYQGFWFMTNTRSILKELQEAQQLIQNAGHAHASLRYSH